MKNKFTFKKHPKETGLSAVGNPYPDVDIKHKKKIVGMIASPNWRTKDNKWAIRLMLKDKENFQWVTLKARFDNEAEARQFLNERVDQILDKDLYYMDPDE